MSRSLHLILLLGMHLALGGITAAQGAGRYLRVALEVKGSGAPYQLYPAGRDGLFLVWQAADDPSHSPGHWVVQFYDAGLLPRWKMALDGPQDASLVKAFVEDGSLHMLLTGKAGGGMNDAVVARIGVTEGDTSSHRFIASSRNNPYFFSRLGDGYLLAAGNRAFESEITLLGQDGSILRPDIGLADQHWLDDAVWDPEAREIIMVFKHRESRKSHGLVVMALDDRGQRKMRIDLTEDRGRWPSAGRLALRPGGGVLLTGTYRRDGMTTSFNSDSPSYETASGFFTAAVLAGKVDSLSYYPFSSFSNYFATLTYNEVSRIRPGKDDVLPAIDFNVMLHGLQKSGEGWVLVAEAYFEKYHYVSRMTYDFYGRPVPTTYTVFEGYQYTNAFIAALDSTGKKSWDDNFDIKNFLRKDLRQVVEVLPAGAEVVMAYMDEGRIASQLLGGGELAAEFTYSPLQGTGRNERISDAYMERIVHWYDQYVLCSGYHKVRTVGTAGGDRRNEFYFTKVTYQ